MSGLEPLLLGSAATATAGATAGLIGTAGSLTLGGVLSTVGAITGIAGAAAGTRAEANAADYNASVTRMEARAEEARRRRAADRQRGAIKSGIGKSGVTTQGTPLMVLAESAEIAEIDALNARWQGETTAALHKSQAKSLRKSIPFTVGASLLSTAGSRLSRKIA